MMAASPLAGRLLERMPANRIALAGAALSGVGLIAIGSWNIDPVSRTPALLAALIAQGFGVGLFQVAYMDVVIGTIPQRDRGVSGSIAMLTRTLGIVGGATLLTLLFNSVDHRALSGGASVSDAFMAAFRLTFYLAGTASILTGAAALVVSSRRQP
jgi:hypothetical protein